MTEQIKNLMRSLKISEAEAREIIEYDNKVDKAKAKDKLKYDLTDEQEKETRKYRQVDRTPTVYNFNKRERKPNEPKRELIEYLRKSVEDFGVDDLEVTNIERQLDFKWNGVRYRIVLSAPRK